MNRVEAIEDILGVEALGSGVGLSLPGGATPEHVVAPRDAEECARLMRWATSSGIGVLPVGGGARSRPFESEGRWVALSTERMDGIETYEAADLTLTAAAGTPMADVAAAMRPHRQWAPFDPPRVGEGTIGGFVSVADSGPLWAGYGEVRNHVLGATIVTGDGRILRLGGRVVKNVAGFDLLKLVVGGRGSFGVVTSVCIRAFPEPIEDRVLVLASASLPELAGPALQVATAPIVPVSSVIVDRLPTSDTPGLVIRLHGSRVTVDADQRRLEAHLGLKLATIDNRATFAAEVSNRGASDDIVIRVSTLPSLLGGLLGVVDGAGASSVGLDAYGARGRVSFSESEGSQAARFLDAASALGATVAVESAPHTSPLWARADENTSHEAELMDGLRRAFDPEGVLWPTRS